MEQNRDFTGITVYTGNTAWDRLSDQDFLREWAELYNQCPWGTPFQTAAFICPWFKHYQSRFSPIIVQKTQDQHVHGLLILAVSVQEKKLVIAGAHQAEYHVWLALPDESADFIEHALHAITQTFPGYDLVFKYVPKNTPVYEVLESKALHGRIELNVWPRPLMRIDAKDIEESFRKKSNKSRFNQLKRCGEVEFKRLTDPAEFAALFDDMISSYDFRQGAVHHSFPFLQDPHKKPFHLELFTQTPEILHVTVTFLNKKPIAAHLGVIGAKQMHIAILTYAPSFASYSPGKLHLMQLGKLLLQEGVELLDLTPGGDPWKERFANDHDEVYELIVHKSALAKTLRTTQTKAINSVKRAAASLGIPAERLREFSGAVTHLRTKFSRSRLPDVFRKRAGVLIYRRTLDALPPVESKPQIKKDDLAALLQYIPAQAWPRKAEFLSEALTRLECGEHVYTAASDAGLLHYGWLRDTEPRAVVFPEIQQRFEYPDQSALMYDFHTHPTAQAQGFYHQSLQQILAELAERGTFTTVYSSVLTTDSSSRQVLEELGFEYHCALLSLKPALFSPNKKGDSGIRPT